VSLFPGAIGIDFANEVDAIFAGRFKNADRLIIDVRGNPGGGIGVFPGQLRFDRCTQRGFKVADSP